MEGAAETTSDLLGRATARLVAAGIESPEIEAELLLEHVTGIPRLRRRIGLAPVVDPAQADAFLAFIERRTHRVPLQHLVGFADFLDLRIRVTPDVLIPRPETEQLVLRARERLPFRPGVQVADLGTGSGCIALAMAATRPDVRADAFDLSGPALGIARGNAALNGLQDRITFHQAGVFGPDARLVEGRAYDLIVTNPPYIPTGELAELMPEVRDHDPRLALDGGPDGLTPYRNLALLAQDWLNTGGWLLAEFGDGQADDLRRIFATHGWSEISIEKDLSGRDRILIVRTSRPRNPANQLGIGDGGLPAHSHHG
jgi:release factor glutamine methyltransferase